MGRKPREKAKGTVKMWVLALGAPHLGLEDLGGSLEEVRPDLAKN